MSQFLTDRRQFLRLDGKVRVSVDVVSGVSQGRFVEQLCLYCTPPGSSTLSGAIW